MVSDLEALVGYYRSRGLTEDEAAQRAEEKLLVSPEALQHLIAVHTTGYQRWVSRAAGRLRWGFDLVLFLFGVLPILLAGVLVIAARVPTMGAGPLLWPMLVCGCGITGIAALKAYQMFVKDERSTARLHRGLRSLVFFGGMGPLLGFLALIFGLHRLTEALSIGLDDVSDHVAISEQPGRDATLLAMGLLLAFGAGIVWFVLVNRIAAIERAESAAFLALE
jgi:hypothetical protein